MSAAGGQAVTRRAFLASLAAAAYAQTKPNIILILADDLGYGDLSCYGGATPTPNLDKLAANGLRFTDFHSSGAVCSPTRAGLMTGRYQQRAGVEDVLYAAGDRAEGLKTSEITFPKLLKQAGYRTAMFGKWHLGYQPQYNPVHHGFDEFRGYVSGNVDYFSHVDQAGHDDWWVRDKQSPEEGYVTHVITKHARRVIEENKGRPFFLYLAHEAVHAPWQGPHGEPFRVAGKNVRQPDGDHKASFRAMLQELDKSVGDTVSSVEKAGLAKNTLIFFTSDNGAPPMGSSGSLRGNKGSVWEGGHRVPAIAYWPGRIKPGVSGTTGITLDLFSTFTEIAGAPKAGRKLDGVSLASHLFDRKPIGERTIFWRHAKQRAMREGDWKLVLLPNAEPFLANLRQDPNEKNNLAASQPARVQAMIKAIEQWEKEVA